MRNFKPAVNPAHFRIFVNELSESFDNASLALSRPGEAFVIHVPLDPASVCGDPRAFAAAAEIMRRAMSFRVSRELAELDASPCGASFPSFCRSAYFAALAAFGAKEGEAVWRDLRDRAFLSSSPFRFSLRLSADIDAERAVFSCSASLRMASLFLTDGEEKGGRMIPFAAWQSRWKPLHGLREKEIEISRESADLPCPANQRRNPVREFFGAARDALLPAPESIPDPSALIWRWQERLFLHLLEAASANGGHPGGWQSVSREKGILFYNHSDSRKIELSGEKGGIAARDMSAGRLVGKAEGPASIPKSLFRMFLGVNRSIFSGKVSRLQAAEAILLSRAHLESLIWESCANLIAAGLSPREFLSRHGLIAHNRESANSFRGWDFLDGGDEEKVLA